MKPEELKKKLKGVVHLALTPFKENGDLDEKSLRQSVQCITKNEMLKKEDVVYLSMGTTGEFYSMSDDENKKAIDIIAEEVNGQFPLLIGAARAGTRYTIEMAKYAQKAGADGVLIIHPYYAMPTVNDIIAHYETIAEALDIGIVIYNNPTPTKLWLPPPVIKKLSKVENIIGLKENSNNPMTFLKMIQTLDPKDISIFAGLGHFMYQFMCFYGCDGYVTELLNYAPHLAIELLHAGREKDVDRIRKVVDKISLFWNWVFAIADKRSPIPGVYPPFQMAPDMPVYQAANKAAAVLTGNPCGFARAPMSNITAEEKEQLKKILVNMDCKVK
jgi:4-hydroxy-tetrahydrodipicolinate synthase